MPVYAAPPHRYAAPLRRWLRMRGYSVAAVPPPEALGMVERGEASSGLAPLGLLLEPRRARLCGMAPMVWSLGGTGSVLVVSRPGVSSLRGCGRVAVSGESRTSVLYLAAVAAEEAPGIEVVQARWRDVSSLLSVAPCALVLGDRALEALARGLPVVVDVGEAVWRLFRSPAVYAATVAAPGERCPRGPPWPVAMPIDVEETSRLLGLPRGLAEEYHFSMIRLWFDESALLEALSLLRRGAEALASLSAAAGAAGQG